MTVSQVFLEHFIPLQNQDVQVRATKQLLLDIFPSWIPDKIAVTSLKGGITNCLLQCVYMPNTSQEFTVLVRAYGRGTGTIIDRSREYCTHIRLYSHGLAPPLYARFQNGLVYGFIAGRSVDYHELSNPLLMKGVAKMLAQWHTVLEANAIKMLIRDEFPDSCSKQSEELVDDIWQLCAKWINKLPSETTGQEATKTALVKELNWVMKEICDKGGPTVVSHCDLLSGNIIVPEDWKPDKTLSATSPPVTFIDYEYSLPTPRAFDLANHFMEWQGFDCNVSLIPKVGGPTMREWGKTYLEGVKTYSKHIALTTSSFINTTTKSEITVSESEVDSLMEEIRTWWGMPGFYWGIWAIIQSTISTIDFDYVTYSRNRLSEYWSWKQDYIENKQKVIESNL
ncbi:kinase-like domain-containing protein [Lipomyces oligophaga]|uniref:kinase-like domain-containing protein n=1 Tax=Lipomyces oligophaga TaxID=45792 RepID=UPI0034CE8A38